MKDAQAVPGETGGQRVVGGGGPRRAVRGRAVEDAVEVRGQPFGLDPARVAERILVAIAHGAGLLPGKLSAARKFSAESLSRNPMGCRYNFPQMWGKFSGGSDMRGGCFSDKSVGGVG
ncbi:hypothetical protein [Azospirillum canadense]|uniref:hypothetical protein n=1 Tax=Azospirillum canadense TaxID=403962 RepID=UPI002225E047|nr:hypothetical protein [Azospirillum canadense]MCW2240950.1 hypothetical protein [Azospirillum canadense]